VAVGFCAAQRSPPWHLPRREAQMRCLLRFVSLARRCLWSGGPPAPCGYLRSLDVSFKERFDSRPGRGGAAPVRSRDGRGRTRDLCEAKRRILMPWRVRRSYRRGPTWRRAVLIGHVARSPPGDLNLARGGGCCRGVRCVSPLRGSWMWECDPRRGPRRRSPGSDLEEP
jgi:hypothetical protein